MLTWLPTKYRQEIQTNDHPNARNNEDGNREIFSDRLCATPHLPNHKYQERPESEPKSDANAKPQPVTESQSFANRFADSAAHTDGNTAADAPRSVDDKG